MNSPAETSGKADAEDPTRTAAPTPKLTLAALASLLDVLKLVRTYERRDSRFRVRAMLDELGLSDRVTYTDRSGREAIADTYAAEQLLAEYVQYEGPA